MVIKEKKTNKKTPWIKVYFKWKYFQFADVVTTAFLTLSDYTLFCKRLDKDVDTDASVVLWG